jgi:hypothetical protein
MKNYKKWFFIIAPIVIIGLIICLSPWRHKIDVTLKGVQCRFGSDDYSEEVSIHVEGVYKQYLFKADAFEGSVSVDKYASTHDKDVLPVSFHDGYGQLVYDYIEDGNFHTNSFGFIFCTPEIDKLFISVYEPIDSDSKGWSGKDGLFICAPAENREQALEIAKSLSSKSQWLSQAQLD